MGMDLHVITTDLDGNTQETEFAGASWATNNAIKDITGVSLFDTLDEIKCGDSIKIIEDVISKYDQAIGLGNISKTTDNKELLVQILNWAKKYKSAKWDVY